MKIIEYTQLFRYLMKEERLNPFQACYSIGRIRSLPREYKESVFQILSGLTPNIKCNEISLSELIEKDHLSPIRAILMLDWIRREPLVAVRYMSTERYRASQIVTEDDKEKLKKAMVRFNTKKSEDIASDETDIIIN